MVRVSDENLALNAGDKKAKLIGVSKGVDFKILGEGFGEGDGVVNFLNDFFGMIDSSDIILDFDLESAVLYFSIVFIDEKNFG
jgi:hypothetical protein